MPENLEPDPLTPENTPNPQEEQPKKAGGFFDDAEKSDKENEEKIIYNLEPTSEEAATPDTKKEEEPKKQEESTKEDNVNDQGEKADQQDKSEIESKANVRQMTETLKLGQQYEELTKLTEKIEKINDNLLEEGLKPKLKRELEKKVNKLNAQYNLLHHRYEVAYEKYQKEWGEGANDAKPNIFSANEHESFTKDIEEAKSLKSEPGSEDDFSEQEKEFIESKKINEENIDKRDGEPQTPDLKEGEALTEAKSENKKRIEEINRRLETLRGGLRVNPNSSYEGIIKKLEDEKQALESEGQQEEKEVSPKKEDEAVNLENEEDVKKQLERLYSQKIDVSAPSVQESFVVSGKEGVLPKEVTSQQEVEENVDNKKAVGSQPEPAIENSVQGGETGASSSNMAQEGVEIVNKGAGKVEFKKEVPAPEEDEKKKKAGDAGEVLDLDAAEKVTVVPEKTVVEAEVIKKEDPRVLRVKERDFYNTYNFLEGQPDLEKDAKEREIYRIRKMNGGIYKNKQDYINKKREKTAEEVYNQEWEAILDARWDKAPMRQTAYYKGPQDFKEKFGSETTKKWEKLNDELEDLGLAAASRDSVHALVRDGYDLGSVKKGWFGKISIKKEVIEKDKNGNPVVREVVEKFNLEDFRNFILGKAAEEKKIITGLVEKDLEKKYQAARGKFNRAVEKDRKELVEESFETWLKQGKISSFNELVQFLNDKKMIKGGEGAKREYYSSDKVVARLIDCRGKVLNNKSVRESMRKKDELIAIMMADKAWNKPLVLKFSELLDEELEEKEKKKRRKSEAGRVKSKKFNKKGRVIEKKYRNKKKASKNKKRGARPATGGKGNKSGEERVLGFGGYQQQKDRNKKEEV